MHEYRALFGDDGRHDAPRAVENGVDVREPHGVLDARREGVVGIDAGAGREVEELVQRVAHRVDVANVEVLELALFVVIDLFGAGALGFVGEGAQLRAAIEHQQLVGIGFVGLAYLGHKVLIVHRATNDDDDEEEEEEEEEEVPLESATCLLASWREAITGAVPFIPQAHKRLCTSRDGGRGRFAIP